MSRDMSSKPVSRTDGRMGAGGGYSFKTGGSNAILFIKMATTYNRSYTKMLSMDYFHHMFA